MDLYLQEHLSNTTIQTRLGNDYPRWTRKFSLGNGPADWVQEYMITKESGKMLGTLVALAVARMVNLETFVWDMPTGVLRDVWLALSSLQYRKREKGDECRLERVWVRWHDNSDSNQGVVNPPASQSTTIPPGTTMTNIGLVIPSSFPNPQVVPTQPNGLSSISTSSQNRVEYPTLSVLPPLKSLSVLDIDELAYLDEMSILIAKSQKKLRELRVGIASKAAQKDFALPWDGPSLQQVDHDAKWPSASTIGDKRLGGVLGVLFGRVFDIRKKPKRKPTAQVTESIIVPHEQVAPNDNTLPVTVQPSGVISGLSPGLEGDRSKAGIDNQVPEEGERIGGQTQPVAEREQLKGQLKLQVSTFYP